MSTRRRSESRGSHEPGRSARKASQLCSQVERTLNYVLSGECDDDVLRDLVVDSVIPAPDDKHLLVTLAPLPAAGGLDPTEVIAHVARARDLLRREVASSITRKRVPELTFRFNPTLVAPPLPATLLKPDADEDEEEADEA